MTGQESALLMTYGSPASLDRGDVAAYLARVRGGREPTNDLVDEFTRRYRVIGGSPLIEITRRQAAALEEQLGWPVEAGMRYSEPTIAAALERLAQRGAERVAAIVLSPQYSTMLMDGYRRAVDEACRSLGSQAPQVDIAGAWHTEPTFVDALAGRIRDGLEAGGHRATSVLLTAHSLPRRVAEREPAYIEQLQETARAVATASVSAYLSVTIRH